MLQCYYYSHCAGYLLHSNVQHYSMIYGWVLVLKGEFLPHIFCNIVIFLPIHNYLNPRKIFAPR